MVKKEHSMPLSQYFKYIKPKYKYIKITPHKSLRNYNSSNIAIVIAKAYKSINKLIRFENKKLFFEAPAKISYIVDIHKNDVSFYFIVADVYLDILYNKISDVWNKATIEVMEESMTPFSLDATIYEVSYKREDALSLSVDKKDNQPLNSALSVMESMEYTDRIGIVYNFMPCSQNWWSDNYNGTMRRLKEHKSVEKADMTLPSIARNVAITIVSILDAILEEIQSFFNMTNDEKKVYSLYDSIMGILGQSQKLSTETISKKDKTILTTQIAVLSESRNEERKTSNALTVCSSFRSLDGDNELRYRALNKSKRRTFNMENYNLETKSMVTSCDEASKFIQLPGKTLLNEHNITHIKTNESKIPTELQTGKKLLGRVTYKGTTQSVFFEDKYNSGNLPLVCIAAMGAGKSTFLKNYSTSCNKSKESIIILDFIKNCELSDDIIAVLPKEDVVVIDLSTQEGLQGFGFNEFKIPSNVSAYEKCKYVSNQTQAVLSLIDSINSGANLTSKMRKYFSAATSIAFLTGHTSIKSIVSCLEDHNTRRQYIDELCENSELKKYQHEEIMILRELDEYSKAKDDETPEVIGTQDYKIEHILDRVALLREDFLLKCMYNQGIENNVDLVDCMDKGKAVFIKMRDSDFPTRMQKNIMVTYFMSKIWISSQVRGKLHGQPSRCNVIIDEVFQAPTVMDDIQYILPQTRKYGTKLIFTTQYAEQLKDMFKALHASGSTFMLLSGCTEEDFNRLKSNITGYDYEDLRDMPKYHALCSVRYSVGTCSFICKLPDLPAKIKAIELAREKERENADIDF